MKNAQKPDKTPEASRFENVNETWRQYKNAFPNDEDCLQEILERALKAGLLRCHKCGLVQSEAADLNGRFFRCPDCQSQVWITGQCVLRSVRNLSLWLGAIWMIERGITFNAFDLHRVATVAYSTAWNVFRKLSLVIERELPADSLMASSAVLAAFVCKRSRETPARFHPRAEEDNENLQRDTEVNFADLTTSTSDYCQSDEQSSGPMDIASCSQFVSSASADHAATILKLLAEGPMHFDQLCELMQITAGQLSVALSILEIDGKIEAIGGARFRLLIHEPDYNRRQLNCNRPGFHWIANYEANMLVNALTNSATTAGGFDGCKDFDFQQFLDKLILFLKHNFHGVSRKYLQMYLMSFWTRADRSYWSSGTLLEACLQFESLTRERLEQYISPKLCKILPLYLVAGLATVPHVDVRIQPTTSPV